MTSYYDPNVSGAGGAADPRMARQQVRTNRQIQRTAARQTGGAAGSVTGTAPPPPSTSTAAPPGSQTTPAGPAQQGSYGQQGTTAATANTTPQQRAPMTPQGPPPGPRRQGPYGYQGATTYAASLSDPGTQYEQDVLGGKYLTPESNPYLSKYVDDVERRFQGNLNRGLSAVSSPFMSGATLGQTGIHADVRGRYFNEGMQDLGGQVSKIYADEYGRERGLQQQTSQDISQRTQNLRNVSSQNYGTDVQARTQIQTAKIQAQTTMQQARMAQQLGYDQLAGELMFKAEQLNQNAIKMEQDWILGSGGLQAGIMRDFSGDTTTGGGSGGSSTSNILQGILGGGIAGAGINAGAGYGPWGRKL